MQLLEIYDSIFTFQKGLQGIQILRTQTIQGAKIIWKKKYAKPQVKNTTPLFSTKLILDPSNPTIDISCS